MELLEPFHRIISIAVEFGLVTAVLIAFLVAVL